jgi:O-antigen/teichoic acid export membrane protein
LIFSKITTGHHRTLNNAVFNTLPWAVSAILGLVFTPFIVHGFGVRAYGVLTVTLAIVGYLSLLDLNIDSAVVKYVAQYQSEGSIAKVNEVVGISIVLVTVIGTTGGLALFLSAGEISTRLLRVDPNLIAAARSAISIGAMGFIATLFLSAATSIVNGLNRFHITGVVKIGSSVLISLGTVLLVIFRRGIEWVVFLNVITSLLGVLVLMWAATRLLPGLRFKPVLHSIQIKKILRFCGYTSLGRFSYLMHFHADRIIAGILLGTASVTFYTVPCALIQRIMDIVSRLAYVTYPLVSELQGKNDVGRIRDVYLNSSRLMLAVATAIALPLLIFGNRFLAAWMGPAFERNTGLVLPLTTLALYLNTMSQVPSLVLNGLGYVRITGLFSLASTVVYFAFMYPLASSMGVSGIAAALLISRLVIVPIFLMYANHKVIQLPMSKLLDVYLRPIMLGLFMWLLSMWAPLQRIHNVVVLLCTMAFAGALYLVVALAIGVIKSAEKQAIINYLYALT